MNGASLSQSGNHGKEWVKRLQWSEVLKDRGATVSAGYDRTAKLRTLSSWGRPAETCMRLVSQYSNMEGSN